MSAPTIMSTPNLNPKVVCDSKVTEYKVELPVTHANWKNKLKDEMYRIRFN